MYASGTFYKIRELAVTLCRILIKINHFKSIYMIILQKCIFPYTLMRTINSQKNLSILFLVFDFFEGGGVNLLKKFKLKKIVLVNFKFCILMKLFFCMLNFFFSDLIFNKFKFITEVKIHLLIIILKVKFINDT